jgi:hypothetical protein
MVTYSQAPAGRRRPVHYVVRHCRDPRDHAFAFTALPVGFHVTRSVENQIEDYQREDRHTHDPAQNIFAHDQPSFIE